MLVFFFFIVNFFFLSFSYQKNSQKEFCYHIKIKEKNRKKKNSTTQHKERMRIAHCFVKKERRDKNFGSSNWNSFSFFFFFSQYYAVYGQHIECTKTRLFKRRLNFVFIYLFPRKTTQNPTVNEQRMQLNAENEKIKKPKHKRRKCKLYSYQVLGAFR